MANTDRLEPSNSSQRFLLLPLVSHTYTSALPLRLSSDCIAGSGQSRQQEAVSHAE